MKLSFAIKRGLVSLLKLTGISFSNLHYDATTESWCLPFRVQLATGYNKYIPAETDWVAIIPSTYPAGLIEIFPAAETGIKHTFQHQEYNLKKNGSNQRSGKICVNVPLSAWGREHFSAIPNLANNKLKWHIERSLVWIRRAAADRLVEYGDPFELPPLPDIIYTPISFNESAESYKSWLAMKGRVGIVELGYLPFKDSKHSFCGRFISNKKDEIVYDWGSLMSKTLTDHKGIWVLLSAIPVAFPWQLPATWTELQVILKKQGVSLIQIFETYFGKNPCCLMLGFPIPKNFGEETERVHWLAIKTPTLSFSKGFRPGTRSHILHILRLNNHCKWFITENWSQEQTTSRSKLNNKMTEKKMLFIGAGSVGSIISELCCRMGCRNITIADFDLPSVGNYSRHTLTMEELHLYKAEGVVNRLNSAMPHVKAKALTKSIGDIIKIEPGFMHQFDVIIDVTAEDEVLDVIEKNSTTAQHVISISTGYRAKRGYCYSSPGGNGLNEDFINKIRPWSEMELAEKDDTLEFEGAGCWHPLFPARYDDILSVVSPCIRIIENSLTTDNNTPELTIIERQINEEGSFNGLNVTTINNDIIHNRSVA